MPVHESITKSAARSTKHGAKLCAFVTAFHNRRYAGLHLRPVSGGKAVVVKYWDRVAEAYMSVVQLLESRIITPKTRRSAEKLKEELEMELAALERSSLEKDSA
jgi:hypothetical protein